MSHSYAVGDFHTLVLALIDAKDHFFSLNYLTPLGKSQFYGPLQIAAAKWCCCLAVNEGLNLSFHLKII